MSQVAKKHSKCVQSVPAYPRHPAGRGLCINMVLSTQQDSESLSLCASVLLGLECILRYFLLKCLQGVKA